MQCNKGQPLKELVPDYLMSPRSPLKIPEKRPVESTTISPVIPCGEINQEIVIIKTEENKKVKKSMFGWGWTGALFLWFVILIILWWLIYYSLRPSFLNQPDSDQIDTAKVLLAAVITALIFTLIIWLIKWLINRRK